MPVLSEINPENVQKILERLLSTFKLAIKREVRKNFGIPPDSIEAKVSITIRESIFSAPRNIKISTLSSLLAKDLLSRKNLERKGFRGTLVSRIENLFRGKTLKYDKKFSAMTVKDLVQFGRRNLVESKNIGRGMVDIIQKMLEAEGFELNE